jgi:tetratricopeptide (TPR) repeat protein
MGNREDRTSKSSRVSMSKKKPVTDQVRSKRSREDLDRDTYRAFQKHRCGRFDEAFDVYSRVLREDPNHEHALHYMGLLAQQSGKTQDAEKLILRSLKIRPENPDALNHLGQVYIALEDSSTAARCFRQAISYNPNHFNAINNLANCFRSAGSMETALIHYERAVAIEPNNPITVYNLGSTLKSMGRHWEAVDWLTKATRCQPNHFLAHHKLGACMEQLGRFDEAQEFYIKALEIEPEYYESLAALLSLPDYESGASEIDQAKKALTEADLDPDVRTSLEHALGRYFDKTTEYDQAFEHFRNCNNLQRAGAAPFDIEAVASRFQSYAEFYTRSRIEELAVLGNRDERPIFVVGLPRTGTTLTEQILSSHSSVFGAGELKEMQRAANRVALPVNKGGLGGFDSVPLDGESIQYLSAEYLAILSENAPSDSKRIVDKFPMNCLNLGLIAILFPNAKIIHCKRSPLDVAISCFSVLFKMDNDFTNDLKDFGHFYLEYERLMAHWHEVLPNRVHTLDYESMVDDVELETRAIVDYCNLQWEDACLKFNKNDRAVSTPSKWQVRQGIFSSSVNRWTNYEKHMVELREILANSV